MFCKREMEGQRHITEKYERVVCVSQDIVTGYVYMVWESLLFLSLDRIQSVLKEQPSLLDSQDESRTGFPLFVLLFLKY